MNESGPGTCEACGKSARVRILEGYDDAGAVFRVFCMECADQYDPNESQAGSSFADGPGRSLAPLILWCGAGVVIAIAIVDIAGLRGHAGFGLYQRLGLICGVVLLTVGAVLRVDMLAVAGAGLLGLVVVADGVSDAPGLGWKQQSAVGLGLAMMTCGLFVRRRELARTRAAQARDSDKSERGPKTTHP